MRKSHLQNWFVYWPSSCRIHKSHFHRSIFSDVFVDFFCFCHTPLILDGCVCRFPGVGYPFLFEFHALDRIKSDFGVVYVIRVVLYYSDKHQIT